MGKYVWQFFYWFISGWKPNGHIEIAERLVKMGMSQAEFERQGNTYLRADLDRAMAQIDELLRERDECRKVVQQMKLMSGTDSSQTIKGALVDASGKVQV